MDSDVPPVISLPEDEERIEQLKQKLSEYEERCRSFENSQSNEDASLKIVILRKLLENGEVFVQELQEELAIEYAGSFDPENFARACFVISDYCKTGGANVSGGTGLKPTAPTIVRQWICRGCRKFHETYDGLPPKECICECTEFYEKVIKSN